MLRSAPPRSTVLQTCRAVSDRCVCRRLHRPIPALLWLFQQFGLSLSAAAIFFFWSKHAERILPSGRRPGSPGAAASSTMVFTHIRPACSFILAPFAPNLYIALGCCCCGRDCRRWMCRRAPLVCSWRWLRHPSAGGCERHCRAAQPRIIDQSCDRRRTTDLGIPGLPLVICGALKITYDIALLSRSGT